MRSNEDRIINLITLMYDEVIAAGGDGDGLWYCTKFSIRDEILPIIESFNDLLEFPWDINYDSDSDTIFFGDNQEGFVITSDDKEFIDAPDWQQILIRW